MIRNLRDIAAGVTPKPQDSSKEEIPRSTREGLEKAGLIEQSSPARHIPYVPESFEDAQRRRQLQEDMFGAPWERCGGDPPDEYDDDHEG